MDSHSYLEDERTESLQIPLLVLSGEVFCSFLSPWERVGVRDFS